MTISGTVAAGEPIAGFEVVELAGHAPGQIGLWRESDGVALVSDTVYLTSMTGRPTAAHVPHEAYNQDTAAGAREHPPARRAAPADRRRRPSRPDDRPGRRRRARGRGAVNEAAATALGELLGERFATSPSIIGLHSRDESRFAPREPDAVAFAHSTEEVAAILRICSEHGVPVVPFGAGSSLEGHVLPVQGGARRST